MQTMVSPSTRHWLPQGRWGFFALVLAYAVLVLAFTVWAGERVALVDPNGAGNSSLLKVLGGFLSPIHRAELAALPMWQTASVGDMHVGIVHGDAQSLAGWGFAQEHLANAAHRDQVREWFEQSGMDAFACSHTCLPVYQSLKRHGRQQPGWVFNNGAAGMPNFQGDPAGLLTRIAITPYPGGNRRVGVVHGPVHIDALAISPPASEVQQRFLAQWPPGSDAHASYFSRIAAGPNYHPHQVIRQED